MIINSNIRAMVTQHALYQNNTAMSKSLEKLSTGLKINRAQDDAAGLAMSEQMRTQIRGLGKAKQNAQDGQAALQIAEGALAEITNCMQRQRELAIQAGNDTLTSTERKYLDDEFQELSKEIGRIALSTDYNGKNLLSNGSFNGGTAGKNVFTSDNSFGVVGSISGTGPHFSATGVQTFNGPYGTVSYGGTQVYGNGIAADTVIKGAHSFTLHVGANYSTNVGGNMANQLAVTYNGINFGKYGGTQLYDFTIGNFGASSSWSGIGAVHFGSLSIAGNLGISTNTIAALNGGVHGVKGIYMAIDALDGAIKSISGTRAKIGTFINRLDYTVNNISSLEYNTQDAESRIRDTNFATETTKFTKNQIMVQSATSMLAQANALPQSVLGLLG